MGIWESVKAKLGRVFPSPSTPYYVEYALSQGSLAKDAIPIDQYPGLLFFYLICPQQESVKLATCWITKEHFLRDGKNLGESLHAETVELEGFIDNFNSRSLPIWRRFRWHTVILGIAAFLGAIEAIGNHYDWLFAAPYIVLESKSDQLNFIEQSNLYQNISIVNRSAVAHRNLRLSAELRAKFSPAVRLKTFPEFTPHIPENESEEIKITGSTPPPGSYELVVHANAKAGVLRYPREFTFTRSVLVWPQTPKASLSVKLEQDNIALLTGQLSIGPPALNGLDCELMIEKSPQLEYRLFDFPYLYGTPAWGVTDSPGEELASLVWQVRPVGEFKQLQFQLALRGRDDTDWNKISREAKIYCYYRKEAWSNEI